MKSVLTKRQRSDSKSSISNTLHSSLDVLDWPTTDPEVPTVTVPSTAETSRVTDQDGLHSDQAYNLPFQVVPEPNFRWAEVDNLTFPCKSNSVHARTIH